MRHATTTVRPPEDTKIPSSPAAAARPTPEDLVQRHLWLAESLARRVGRKPEDVDELRQVALVALWHAGRRYDPDRGVPFEGFAHKTILGEIKRHRRDTGWGIRLPRAVHDSLFQVTGCLDELTQQLGRSPTIAELSARSGVAEEMVVLALEGGQKGHPLSSDALADTLGDADASLSIPDTGQARVAERDHIRSLLRVLSERERTIVVHRFFDDLNQREIAGKVGCSQMQVSRILARALSKLRAAAAHATPAGV